MGEPRFRSDEPWGDYGEWFLLGGHVDKAEAFAEFDKTHRSYGGESFAEWGITVDDVLHGYATPSLYPPAGWEPDEWMQFSEQPWDETSIPVTILHAEGAGNVPTTKSFRILFSSGPNSFQIFEQTILSLLSIFRNNIKTYLNSRVFFL